MASANKRITKKQDPALVNTRCVDRDNMAIS